MISGELQEVVRHFTDFDKIMLETQSYDEANLKHTLVDYQYDIFLRDICDTICTVMDMLGPYLGDVAFDKALMRQ